MRHLPGIQPESEREAGELVSRWLDELPWGEEQTATMTPAMGGFAVSAGEEILKAREEGKEAGRREALEGMIEFLKHGLETP
jgi:hypothetical protein